MNTVVSIVEGDGEVTAFPILLRRIAAWLTPEIYVNVSPPIRVRRDRFLRRDEEFKKKLELASLKSGSDGWILILLDADDDCPMQLAREILNRAQKIINHQRISVVLAKYEYEAWFIAAAESLSEEGKFTFELGASIDPESIRGAKEWLSKRMGRDRYHEVTDQPSFSARMNLEQALENSRSFRKLCSEWSKNMTPV